MSSSKEQRVILSIQHLRGVAALMVVWHHAAQQVAGIGEYFPSRFGANGVDLFFAISGFIMVAATNGRDVGVATFLQRRAQRIVPLYWLLTVLMVLVALAVPGVFKSLVVRADTLALSLLFVPHYSASFPGLILPVLVPGWTLNFEMYFYLVFGVLLMVRESWRTGALVAYFALAVALGWLFGPFGSAMVQTYTSTMLLEFAAGAVIARAWLTGRLNLPMSTSVMAIAAGFVLLVAPDAWSIVEGLNRLVGASLIVAGALDRRLIGWRQPLLQRLGDASYSIYLIHLFTLGVLRSAWMRLLPDGPGLGGAVCFMLLAMVVSVAGGCAVHAWVEKPLLNWFAARRRVPVAVQPA